jgi:hypothetical protein
MFSQFDKSLAACDNLEDKLSSEGFAIMDDIFDNDLLATLRLVGGKQLLLVLHDLAGTSFAIAYCCYCCPSAIYMTECAIFN